MQEILGHNSAKCSRHKESDGCCLEDPVLSIYGLLRVKECLLKKSKNIFQMRTSMKGLSYGRLADSWDISAKAERIC